jgi:hypothetical protein
MQTLREMTQFHHLLQFRKTDLLLTRPLRRRARRLAVGARGAFAAGQFELLRGLPLEEVRLLLLLLFLDADEGVAVAGLLLHATGTTHQRTLSLLLDHLQTAICPRRRPLPLALPRTLSR